MRLPHYDPARGSFQAFVKQQAKLLLWRYYEARTRNMETPFSDLLAQFPDSGQEEDIEDVIAGLTPPVQAEQEFEIPPEVYQELLRITFGGSSPPHQLIAFGLVKLLGGKPRKSASKPSDSPLRKLEERLENEYLESSQLQEHRVRDGFRPLRENLGRRFKEVVKASKTLKAHARLMDRKVGDTTLRDSGIPGERDKRWREPRREPVTAVIRAERLTLSDTSAAAPPALLNARLSVHS